MSRDSDALERLCQRVREHEEPDDADRAFVRERLALRIAAAGVGAAGVIGAAKSAAASGAAPALGASGQTATLAGGVFKAWSLAATSAWAAGGASAALVAALVVQSLHTTPPPHATPAQASAIAVPAAPKGAALAPTQRAPRLAPELPSAPEVSTLPVRVAAPVQGGLPKRVHAPESPPEVPKANLAEEAASLARVQGALRDGDPNLALALLDEQDRLYPTGSLGSERAAARALAWCAAGHRTRARTLAERVVAENAGSPLAERVKRKCFGTRSSP